MRTDSFTRCCLRSRSCLVRRCREPPSYQKDMWGTRPHESSFRPGSMAVAVRAAATCARETCWRLAGKLRCPMMNIVAGQLNGPGSDVCRRRLQSLVVSLPPPGRATVRKEHVPSDPKSEPLGTAAAAAPRARRNSSSTASVASAERNVTTSPTGMSRPSTPSSTRFAGCRRATRRRAGRRPSPRRRPCRRAPRCLEERTHRRPRSSRGRGRVRRLRGVRPGP